MDDRDQIIEEVERLQAAAQDPKFARWSDTKPIARGDYVVATGTPHGPVGLVRRVAKDGSWADVWWSGWSKRMKTKYLRVIERPQ